MTAGFFLLYFGRQYTGTFTDLYIVPSWSSLRSSCQKFLLSTCTFFKSKLQDNDFNHHSYPYTKSLLLWEWLVLPGNILCTSVFQWAVILVVYTAFHQHFGRDVSSASLALTWLHGRAAALSRAAQRYTVAQTRSLRWFYVMPLPRCCWNAIIG